MKQKIIDFVQKHNKRILIILAAMMVGCWFLPMLSRAYWSGNNYFKDVSNGFFYMQNILTDFIQSTSFNISSLFYYASTWTIPVFVLTIYMCLHAFQKKEVSFNKMLFWFIISIFALTMYGLTIPTVTMTSTSVLSFGFYLFLIIPTIYLAFLALVSKIKGDSDVG